MTADCLHGFSSQALCPVCQHFGKIKAAEAAEHKMEETKMTQQNKTERPRRRHKLELGECPFCDHERADGNDFHPSHDASPFCDSGKHDHCSCDTCF